MFNGNKIPLRMQFRWKLKRVIFKLNFIIISIVDSRKKRMYGTESLWSQIKKKIRKKKN
jgi:ribosomal silencing factor RsfS